MRKTLIGGGSSNLIGSGSGDAPAWPDGSGKVKSNGKVTTC